MIHAIKEFEENVPIESDWKKIFDGLASPKKG